MKALFWLLAIASLPAGAFMSLTCYMSYGLDLYCTTFGAIAGLAGSFSLLVSILCAVLGFLRLRKGAVKKALVLALIGLLYSALALGALALDDALGTIQTRKYIESQNELLYGPGWDSPSALDGIPKRYEELLNKYYVAVRDRWPADRLGDLAAQPMPEYYGDASLDSIGFALTDLNRDGIQELLIGTTAPTAQGGTAVFCIYDDPETPSFAISSAEGETYYLHAGAAADSYLAEICGQNYGWLLSSTPGYSGLDINYQEGTPDPAGRLTLELIPFSRYK